jgi:hypothetical protein
MQRAKWRCEDRIRQKITCSMRQVTNPEIAGCIKSALDIPFIISNRTNARFSTWAVT